MTNDLAEAEREIYRSVLHTILRDCTPRQREEIHARFADVIDQALANLPRQDLQPWAKGVVERLRDEGYCSIAGILSPQQVAEIRGHFENCVCYNAHVEFMSDRVGRRIGAGAETFHYGCYSLPDIVAAPHLIELANSAPILGMAEQYLGCPPTLYSMNAWWSFSGHAAPASYSQSFHRDLDDCRFCTLFVYLTDVSSESGPHVFVRRSHRQDLIAAHLEREARAALQRLPAEWRNEVADGGLFRGDGYGRDFLVETLLSELIDVIVGPAGDGLIADTYALHKGIPPQKGARLMFWSRYGLYTNCGPQGTPARWRDVEHRLPKDHRYRYINRQILSDD